MASEKTENQKTESASPKAPRRGLSLKYKLLVLLTAVPLLCLAVYSGVAIDLFRNDKVAYIYDSSLAIASGLSSQMRSEINGLMNLIRPLIKGYESNTRKFIPASEYLFAQQEGIQYLAIHHLEENKTLKRYGLLKKEEFEPAGDWVIGEVGRSMVRRAFEQSLVLRPLSEGLVALVIRQTSDEGETTVVFSILKNSTLGNGFRTKSIYANYLIDREGAVLFGQQNNKAEGSLLDWDFFPELRGEELSEKTMEVESPSGEAYLMSAAQIGQTPLLVISMVRKEAALIATERLLWKSVIFLVVILSFSFLLSLLASQRLTSALEVLYQATRRMAAGEYNFKIKVHSRDEVGDLANSFTKMAGEVSRLMEENVEKARMEKELETAKAVQEMLFPPMKSRIDNVEIAGYYTSASECGGDWWHYTDLGDKVLLWIGDATGHGAPAALITSAAKSVASVVEKMPAISPKEAMSLLNTSIYENSKSKVCMTFFIASIDKKSGKMTFCNASHEPPILIPSKGAELKKMHLEPIMGESGPRLGESPESEYVEETMELSEGDTIYFYTDGVTELYGSDGEMFEERRLLRALVKDFKQEPQPDQAVDHLHEVLEEFRDGHILEDDVTYFFARYKGMDFIEEAESDDSENEETQITEAPNEEPQEVEVTSIDENLPEIKL